MDWQTQQGKERVGQIKKLALTCSVKYIDDIEVALTEIGQSAFQYCSNLKILKDRYDQQLSGIVTILGSAFQECTSLGLVINNDDSFKTIGANAFAGADIALNALPDGIEKIGTFAFGNLKRYHLNTIDF